MQIERKIRGYLVGNIWMPNAECYKPIDYDLDDQDARWSERGTLRDHVLRATNDGDFQSCTIADGYLELTTRRATKTGMVTRIKRIELFAFPSISDCVKADWEGPHCDD